MQSIQRIQGQLEIAGKRVEGLDAQHPENSRGGRATRGCREKGGEGGCRASRGFKGNQRLQAEGWKVWMHSIPRIQGVVGQLEVAGRMVEGLDAQHPDDSRGGRATGGWRKKGGGFGCAASRGWRCGRPIQFQPLVAHTAQSFMHPL